MNIWLDQCSTNFSLLLATNTAYESKCTASIAGSGGSKPGGGVVYSSIEHLLELDGAINADAYPSAKAGQGGGSGGTISVNAR